ncbi:MAG: TadE/TadG family type IV pilus assembly protein [Pseudomonadota bacterium]
MRRGLERLARDGSGSAVVEAAFGIPIVIVIVIGLLQVGMAFLVNAGIRHAVETGARFATIYRTPPATAPTDAEIITRMRSSAFGAPAADFTVPTPVRATDATNGQRYVQVTMSYPYRFNMVFISLPAITLTYSRRAYLMPS